MRAVRYNSNVCAREITRHVKCGQPAGLSHRLSHIFLSLLLPLQAAPFHRSHLPRSFPLRLPLLHFPSHAMSINELLQRMHHNLIVSGVSSVAQPYFFFFFSSTKLSLFSSARATGETATGSMQWKAVTTRVSVQVAAFRLAG